jgi:hypothetical protein
VGLGFELRASLLQSRHPATWATPLALFALVILEMGSHELLSRLVWNISLVFYGSSHSWDDRCTPCPQLFSMKMGSCEHLCLGWPTNAILGISASCVAGMTGVHHCAWLINFFVNEVYWLKYSPQNCQLFKGHGLFVPTPTWSPVFVTQCSSGDVDWIKDWHMWADRSFCSFSCY